jgi:hypothetical protein
MEKLDSMTALELVSAMNREDAAVPRAMAAFSHEEELNYVPRTWIIDRQGIWRWVKSGYDESKTYAEFEKDLLNQIGKAEAGQ